MLNSYSSTRNYPYYKLIVLFADLLVVNSLYWVLYALSDCLSWHILDLTAPHYWIAVNVFYIICYKLAGVVLFNRIVRAENVLARVVRVVVDHFLIIAFLSYMNMTLSRSWKIMAIYYVLLFVFLSLERLFLRRVVQNLRIRRRDIVNVVIVGDGDNLKEIAEKMQVPFMGYNLIGVFSDKELVGFPAGVIKLGNVADALPWLGDHKNIGEVYCGLTSNRANDILPIINYCEGNLIRFYSVPNLRNYLKRNMVMETFDDVVVLAIRREPLSSPGKRFEKRLFDIIISGLFLCTIYPFIYIFVGIAIKLSSKGPVYFKQKRNGLDGKVFECIKFRSMKVNAQSDTLQATKDDPRKTKVGDFLRRTNLDELPQFINVFKGDMSLVGPRPHMLKHNEEYARLIDRYMVRHFVKPGITGWAQVNGFRGETKELTEMAGRVQADIWYIEHWNFWLDIRIMFKTVTNMIHGEEKAY